MSKSRRRPQPSVVDRFLTVGDLAFEVRDPEAKEVKFGTDVDALVERFCDQLASVLVPALDLERGNPSVGEQDAFAIAALVRLENTTRRMLKESRLRARQVSPPQT